MMQPCAPYKPLTADQLFEDVLDLVFSFLIDDMASLKSSRLVCRKWAATARRLIFQSIQIRPSNDQTLIQFLTQYPHSETVIPNVRRLEAYGTPGKVFVGYPLIDVLSRHLTHLTFRSSLVASFNLILTVVDNSPNLISLALLDMTFPHVPPQFQYAGRFLPPTLRHLCLRRVPLHPFLKWLIAHPTLPPLTHLNIGTLDDAILPLVNSYVKRVASTLRHFTIDFGRRGGTTPYVCDYSLLDHNSRSKESFNITKIGDFFYKAIGIAPCTTMALMENLCMLQIDGFVDQNAPNESPAEFIAARVFASVSPNIKRVVLGINISSTSQLCQCNINWAVFDEIFTNVAFNHLESIEFRSSGRGDMDNIADFISSRLPFVAASGRLVFRKLECNPPM